MMINQQEIFEFSGTHYELGFQQGKTFKHVAKRALNIFKNLEDVQTMKPWFLPTGIFLRIASSKAKKWLEPIIKNHSPNQAERIKGMADGSGMNENLIYFFSAAELLLGKLDWELPHLKAGCTSIAYNRNKTDSDHVWVSRNFDYNKFIVPFLMLRKNSPEGYFKSFDLTAFPLPGTFNGLNEEGVFLATDEAFPLGELEDGLSASLLIQEALERCSDVEEVIDFFKRSPRGSGNVVLAADSNDNINVMEYTSKRLLVRRPEDQQGFIVGTNHYSVPELKDVDLPREAVFGKKSPRSLWGACINETSYVRKETAENKIKSKDKVTLDWIKSLHRDHGANPDGVGGMNTLCHHDPENISAASMIMDLEAFKAWICFGLPCENEYSEFDISWK